MTDQNPTEQFRLFVAVPIPDPVRDKMRAVQLELHSLAPHSAVRWTKSEQFHLTLRFLGDVPSRRVEDLRESVRAACAGAPALSLRARGVGFFPNARSPRVVWVGINDGKDYLADLQRKIESVVQPFTEESSGEHFAGHVTLGRFKHVNRFRINELKAYVEAMKDRVFGEWTAREIEIIRSELSATGPRYTPLATLRLGMEIAPP